MRFLLLVFYLVIAFGCASQQADTSQYSYKKEVILFLASDEMRGRATGSDQEVTAANFILNELKEIERCKAVRQKIKIDLDSVKFNSQNVIGFINNHAPKTVILSAHYDHLGMGGIHSHSKGENEVHNGADDNASGVALLLSLAKSLSVANEKYNILLVAYSGHEIGLFGSEYFSGHLKKKYKNIELVVNFDMVGRLSSDRTLYYDCTSELDGELISLSTDSLKFTKSAVDRINILDTKWFVAKEIPSITFSTGRHIDYHKTTDDIKYINFEGLELIEKKIADWFETYLNMF